MVTLGLLPPYSLDDVKQSFRAKAHLAHPDHGGSVDEFLALQDAYRAAREFVCFVGDRRAWIASMVERSLRHEAVVTQLKLIGASIETSTLDALRRTLGDFAVLSESVVRVSLTNSQFGGDLLRLLTTESEILKDLKHLRLSGCTISDGDVMRLGCFGSLSSLDLSKTPVTKRSLSIVSSTPTLTELDIRDTRIGWWARRRTCAILRRRQARHAQGEQAAPRFPARFRSNRRRDA